MSQGNTMSYVHKRRTAKLKTARAGIRKSVDGQNVFARKITFKSPQINVYQVSELRIH